MPKGNGKPIPQVVFKSKMNKQEAVDFIELLQKRFQDNMLRHGDLEWSDVQSRLTANPAKLEALQALESTGGQPDVIGYDKSNYKYLFVDCSIQSPARRSVCFDAKGEAERHKKGVFPGGNAMTLAEEMGAELLTEEEYRNLQKLGEFDTTTSSWIQTPKKIRDLGGALFGDRRYDTVFFYHNGAQSFYADRGFRCVVRV